MNFVAIKMLTGDRAKYLGLIFAIAFASFLLENQSSIFAGVVGLHGQPDRGRHRCRHLGPGRSAGTDGAGLPSPNLISQMRSASTGPATCSSFPDGPSRSDARSADAHRHLLRESPAESPASRSKAGGDVA